MKWAGRAWATGAAGPAEDSDGALADARRWGLDLSIEDLRPESDDGLWPEHLAAFEAFLEVASQWRIIPRQAAAPYYAGLDFGAAEAGLRLAGVTVTPELWAQVRVIESAARAALNGV
ncbi:DUF1799 domain-containing protein [Litorisediminicola beolgyonensis]|uniref:DUF1799 domain-containing protein n=1 Tax=Litorisediminicola beolgyonensis TaxID=1173614 RepID=A0ABW3ZIM7_9RHOB